jgi:hypothetical protein
MTDLLSSSERVMIQECHLDKNGAPHSAVGRSRLIDCNQQSLKSTTWPQHSLKGDSEAFQFAPQLHSMTSEVMKSHLSFREIAAEWKA